ncbi:unnamed protein product [Gongylonema pulchrum]|uniref:Cofactor of BRCA1 n=1 Tax=Gongylonema pulchrum TaxID=637853 RepID=A0A183CVC6_9BILA|nr:unnamed protein product [Gongylonema pulchrum]
MSERLLAKIKELGAKGSRESILLLERQLEKSFKLYRVPLIRPFVLETLKQLPRVPDRYLKVIVSDREFYNCCAVTVRQQIWLKNDALYVDALIPILDSYIDAKRKVMHTLMSMVGPHQPLYQRLNDVIRERYLKTADGLYCSLRMELAMSAHDFNLESIIRSDPCHDLARCLDACVRDKHLDAQQTSKLKNILESTKKSKPEVIGDLAMIAGDAHVIHFLCSMSVKVLRDAVAHATGQLPRDLIPLQLLLRMLTFGASAHHILSTNNLAALQNVDSLIFTKFLAAFSILILEDLLRYELARAPDEIVDENPPSDFLSDPSDEIMSFLKTDISCALLWIHYLLDVFPSKRRAADLPGIMRYLKALPRLKDKIAYCDPWAHVIIHRLLQSTPFDNLLSTEQYCQGVKYHLLRIVHLLWPCIGDFRCRLILDKISPENVFEPNVSEEDADVKRYTQEYQRIRAKTAEKSAASEGPKNLPSGDKTPSVPTTTAAAAAAAGAVNPVESIPVDISESTKK